MKTICQTNGSESNRFGVCGHGTSKIMNRWALLSSRLAGNVHTKAAGGCTKLTFSVLKVHGFFDGVPALFAVVPDGIHLDETWVAFGKNRCSEG